MPNTPTWPKYETRPTKQIFGFKMKLRQNQHREHLICLVHSTIPSCLFLPSFPLFCLLCSLLHHPPLRNMSSLSTFFSPPPHQIFHSTPPSSLHCPITPSPSSTKIRASTSHSSTSKFGNFLHLQPLHKTQTLDFDLPLLHPSDHRSRKFDVVVIGAGPAGIRLAEQVSTYGIKVCCVDPDPLSLWPNNYGVWFDEFEELDLHDCLDKTWSMACVYIDDSRIKYLDRSYGRVSRKKLKEKLIGRSVSNGVVFYKAKVWKIEFQEFESSILCDDNTELKASLVVDASGFNSDFIEYNTRRRNHGYQIAHGILAEVEEHPFDLDKMVLMDWRDSHLGNEPYLRENNKKLPTFLYAMPFNSNLIFLEETSLVSRPLLSYMEVKRRMVARLRHLGIRVINVLEVEKCLIPMGGPLPRVPQNAMAFGGNSGVVHPSTGYMVARTMGLAPVVARAIVECLGSTRMIRGKQLYAKVWDSLWPIERRFTREFYCFGMETLLKLDLNGSRGFFDAFFDLKPCYWQGFLSSRLSLRELAFLSLSLFGHASNLSRFDIITKCPLPLARMMSNLALESIG
ncbi:neoxanthin synthase, chloroplastic-like [Prosopis cineraria]|uniref:neoxanthin synthase, chloroplastic-like n=1 Tax=Prosopis cineraria TaxID=364024 RepID=UPI00240F253F|nr:neoxanthin synthase, chloroplastic-like [Prosopis cineraria]